MVTGLRNLRWVCYKPSHRRLAFSCMNAPISPQYIGPHSNLNPILASLTAKAVASAMPISMSDVPSERWRESKTLGASVRLQIFENNLTDKFQLNSFFVLLHKVYYSRQCSCKNKMLQNHNGMEEIITYSSLPF